MVDSEKLSVVLGRASSCGCSGKEGHKPLIDWVGGRARASSMTEPYVDIVYSDVMHWIHTHTPVHSQMHTHTHTLCGSDDWQI